MKQTRCTARAHAFAIAIDGCRAHPGGIASRSRDRRAQAAKTALLEMVALPIKYARLHARAPIASAAGALLYGPPGCGKVHREIACRGKDRLSLSHS